MYSNKTFSVKSRQLQIIEKATVIIIWHPPYMYKEDRDLTPTIITIFICMKENGTMKYHRTQWSDIFIPRYLWCTSSIFMNAHYCRRVKPSDLILQEVFYYKERVYNKIGLRLQLFNLTINIRLFMIMMLELMIK